MKVFKLAALFLVFALASGCSETEETNKPEENTVEEEYIKGTIDNSVKLEELLNELDTLLTDVRPTDDGWKNDVSMIVNNLSTYANTLPYLNGTLREGDNLEEKYKSTIETGSEAGKQIVDIRNDLVEAGKTHDTRLYKEIHPDVKDALENIEATLSNIEEERNK